MRKKDRNLENFKDFVPDKKQIELFENLAEGYKDMSEDEVFTEIKKINNELEESMTKEQYDEMLDKVEDIRPLLSKEQKEKLDMVLKMLGKK